MTQAIQASLREKQYPLIRDLANCIETVWRENLDLSPYQIPEDLGYRSFQSISVRVSDSENHPKISLRDTESKA